MTLNFEDYVRGVYYLKRKLGIAKPTDLARRLRVSKNTVSLMVKKLSIRKLLHHKPYGEVELTSAGIKMAKRLTYRHRLIELFLTEKLGVPAEEVHEEACRLEHDFSEKSIQSIEKILEYPRVDPHGKLLKE